MKRNQMVFVLLVVFSSLLLATVSQAGSNLAPERVTKKIPSFFAYEGSNVLILYDPSGKMIELIYEKNKWRVVKSEVRLDKLKRGKILIVGVAKDGTPLPLGARIGQGRVERDSDGNASAGEGGVNVAIDSEF